MKRPAWTAGNRIDLLENGEAYYPSVFAAIDAARAEVLVQTYILAEDAVGQRLRDHLVAAAKRGVRVELLIDDWGSPDLSDDYRQSLHDAGVRLAVFDPGLRLFGTCVGMFRRLHRKLLVVDGRVAFIGGLNFCHTHLHDCGVDAKLDFAVRLTGPVVAQVHQLMRQTLAPQRKRQVLPLPAAGRDGADAALVVRDNHGHRHDIERVYRLAFRTARRRIVLANAYFFPGWRLLRELRRAARRGVQVDLILQGKPDVPVARAAATLLYPMLQRAGVRVHEFQPHALHAKVAVVDDQWVTVGSSNLDPTSLALNLEANVVVRHAPLARQLGARLQALIDSDCTQPQTAPLSAGRSAWDQLRAGVVSLALRHLPGLLTWWPAAIPKVQAWLPRRPVAQPRPAGDVPATDAVAASAPG